MTYLLRFLDAQKDYYYIALREMREGVKRTHWIWFIFPQIKGLGHSYNSEYYGINGRGEAESYLHHPVLGARLREITEEVLSHQEKGIYTIMGARVDAMKFKSSMTLFDAVSPEDIFAKALDAFFGGERDQRTVQSLTNK